LKRNHLIGKVIKSYSRENNEQYDEKVINKIRHQKSNKRVPILGQHFKSPKKKRIRSAWKSHTEAKPSANRSLANINVQNLSQVSSAFKFEDINDSNIYKNLKQK